MNSENSIIKRINTNELNNVALIALVGSTCTLTSIALHLLQDQKKLAIGFSGINREAFILIYTTVNVKFHKSSVNWHFPANIERLVF